MLRGLLLLHLTALAIGNPFHKYPFVFLLDVGNEELDKVNTEQIRISKQGGSLALRYPAIGNGPDIAHVRVSGIDFGTDLKADIVEGGPGYKYVVLVLMGNQGVNFDAVITIQTVPPYSQENLQNIGPNASNNEISEEDDPNDSAEDLSDNEMSDEANRVSSIKENAELTQESANVYSYAVNEALSGYGDSIHYSPNDNVNNEETDETEDEDDADSRDQNIHIKSSEDINLNESQDDDQTNEGYSPNRNGNYEEHLDNDYYPVIDDQNSASGNDNQEPGSPNLYENEVVGPNSFNRPEAFPQSAVPVRSDTVYIEEPGDESPINLQEIFSDEYDADDGDVRQYSDKNNNFIDRNDRSAVAY